MTHMPNMKTYLNYDPHAKYAGALQARTAGQTASE